MEDFKKKMSADMNDKEIVFSKYIKAGKRIYYLDVKKNLGKRPGLHQGTLWENCRNRYL